MRHRNPWAFAPLSALPACAFIVSFAAAQNENEGVGALPDNDTLMKAMVDELARSMESLTLEDLSKPYFIQYKAEDRLTLHMSASYGGLQRSERDRARSVSSRVRVGSYQLDNTNVGRSMGGSMALPFDDDYTALRHTLWRLTDTDYKRAVEILAQKQAYLKQKNVADRPDDFLPGESSTLIEPSAEMSIDRPLWEKRIKELSARFESYPKIQNAGVTLFAGAVNNWIVNSEGMRQRTSDTGVYIQIRAETQAEGGMRLFDGLDYLGLETDDLPSMDEMISDVDRLCEELIELSIAPVLEHYAGPVLFDPRAAGQAFGALLAERLCARPLPLGAGNRDDRSFEKKIGARVLPRSFNVYDDPTQPNFKGTVLAGSFDYDDEGIRARRVDLIERGILKTLLASRAPTKKIQKSTGHGRSFGLGDARAQAGCLYITDSKGMSAAELRQALIETAREEGLDFALRIESIRTRGSGGLGRPIRAYKVFVDDGREELIRGMQFLPVEPREMKSIIAGGLDPAAYNNISGSMMSIIAPAVLFEELELNKIEREFDKPPILASPFQRAVAKASP